MQKTAHYSSIYQDAKAFYKCVLGDAKKTLDLIKAKLDEE